MKEQIAEMTKNLDHLGMLINALGAAAIQSLENQQKFKTVLLDINERLKSIEKKLDIGQKS